MRRNVVIWDVIQWFLSILALAFWGIGVVCIGNRHELCFLVSYVLRHGVLHD
jgi:hypothetical protein